MELKLLVASLMTKTLASLTLTDAVVIALAIFAAAFLLGLWCGRVWQRRRTWSHAADGLKHRALRG